MQSFKSVEEIQGLGAINPFSESLIYRNHAGYPWGIEKNSYIARLSTAFMAHENSNSGSTQHLPLNLASRFSNRRVHYELPPGCARCTTLETFCIPENVFIRASIIDAYKDLKISLSLEPMQPNQTGHLNLNVINTSDETVKFYALEGFVRINFYHGIESGAPLKNYYQPADMDPAIAKLTD